MLVEVIPMQRPVLITAPAVGLVSVAEAKAQARVDHSDEDTLISALIAVTTSYLDGWSGVLGRCLVNQTWRQDFAEWSNRLRLPFPDVSSVTITYLDTEDAEQTVSSALYELLEDERGSYVAFRDAFTRPATTNDREAPISVEMVAGYGATAADVPKAIRHAALLLVAHWYEHREPEIVGAPVSPVGFAATALLAPYRRQP